MNARDDFIGYELPRLLELARRSGVIRKVDSILLYGGANYGSLSLPGEIPPGKDYDCLILFKEGAVQAAQRYSDQLFTRGKRFLKYSLHRPTLLYEKIESRHSGRILAPFVTTADILPAVIDAHSTVTRGTKYFPWYRLTPRQRSMQVPATAFDGSRLHIPLQQHYVKRHGLWRLVAPAFAVSSGRYYLSFGIEAFLTSSVVYDAGFTVQGLSALAQKVSQRVQQDRPYLVSPRQQADSIYNAFTIAPKAPQAFKDACVERLTRWISR